VIEHVERGVMSDPVEDEGTGERTIFVGCGMRVGIEVGPSRFLKPTGARVTLCTLCSADAPAPNSFLASRT
jgi:hypothetical protein